MRYRRRSVTFAGQPFRFEKIRGRAEDARQATWAVSRRGEFIGTMSCSEEITTTEFDVRCTEWLKELLGKIAPN